MPIFRSWQRGLTQKGESQSRRVVLATAEHSNAGTYAGRNTTISQLFIDFDFAFGFRLNLDLCLQLDNRRA